MDASSACVKLPKPAPTRHWALIPKTGQVVLLTVITHRAERVEGKVHFFSKVYMFEKDCNGPAKTKGFDREVEWWYGETGDVPKTVVGHDFLVISDCSKYIVNFKTRVTTAGKRRITDEIHERAHKFLKSGA